MEPFENYESAECDAQLSDDEEKILDDLGLVGESRRKFLGQTLMAGLGVFAMQLLARETIMAETVTSPGAIYSSFIGLENAVNVAFKVNGIPKSLDVDSRMSLLDALRERLELTGTKKGCDQGQCGACTVIVDGNRILSCLTLAASCKGKEVTTVEGLAKGNDLHPMQTAFIKHDGFQCGYCTPGQLCSAVAMLQEAKNGDASHVTKNIRTRSRNLKLSDDEIRERMSGNICRCGAYPGIVAAIGEVQSGRETAQSWHFATGDEIASVLTLQDRDDIAAARTLVGGTDEIV